MNTLLVNLYGGPCAGKSTVCCGLFYKLKKLGYDCEIASEFAKDKVWEESYKVLEDQIYVFGKQFHRLQRLNGKVEIIITDSPIPLCVYYDNGKTGKHYESLVFESLEKFNHVDYFIERGDSYNENGRIHTLEEATKIDKDIMSLLDKHEIKYDKVPQDIAVDYIVDNIKTLLKKNEEL